MRKLVGWGMLVLCAFFVVFPIVDGLWGSRSWFVELWLPAFLLGVAGWSLLRRLDAVV